ncbi:MAG: M1 family metallopeptidase [Planctomycetaceae bacterium]|nr:M1 family metallopeptidase [Planctomycetaceae bacterium]
MNHLHDLRRRFELKSWIVALLLHLCGLLALSHGQSPDEITPRDLRARRMGPRSDKNIFSALDLPTPNRIRTAAGLPGPDYWQQQADYAMDVTLDPEAETIQAKATITYTNNSPSELNFLWLGLEQNIFRDESLGWKASQPNGRVQSRGRINGGYQIDYVRTGDKEIPLTIHDTLGRLELPAPIPGNGGQFVFEIAWSFKVPEDGINRHGIRRVDAGKIFQLAQWFPHVCKYDDVHGWSILPYLGQGEFYTEFGNFEVQIHVPRGYIVLATGELTNASEVLTESQLERLASAAGSRSTVVIRSEEELGTDAAIPAGEGPLTWRFKAEKVRNFAWTSSSATIWDAATVLWEDGTTVLVQSVYPVEAKSAWSESTQMLRHSIMHYSDQWFRYPYPTATNVNGNPTGMEYPMMLFCSGDDSREWLFQVTSHEIGHTWFPMVVNSDERRHAWMDEGFNTFMNAYDRLGVFDEVLYGSSAPRPLRTVSLRQYGRFNANPRNPPSELPIDQVEPSLVGRLAYGKPGDGLRFLREEILGPERFDAAFKQYIRAWAFKSPQPADFFRCMENGTGMNLNWFWRGWVLEHLNLDQAVGEVVQDPDSPWAEIELLNLDEMVMPVTVEIRFEDDTTRRVSLPVQVWHYTNRWVFRVPTEGKTIQQVMVDPDRRMPDSRRTNNRWEKAGAAEQPTTEDDQ